MTAPAPDRLWVADATRIPVAEGVLWLAAVRDAFSNRIVGWKTSDRCDTDLVLGALEYAIWSRDVRDGQLVHHSDRGSTYTSIRFTQRLADNGILASMGSTGDSFDNALMENCWSTWKIELVYRNAWRTREEADNALFAYIDGWYNPHRIQKDLGWLSPDEYEAAWYAHTRQRWVDRVVGVLPTQELLQRADQPLVQVRRHRRPPVLRQPLPQVHPHGAQPSRRPPGASGGPIRGQRRVSSSSHCK